MHAPSCSTEPAPCANRAYTDAVALLPAHESRPLSLRLHVPGFGAHCAADRAALDIYLAYLRREVTMHAALFPGMCKLRQLRFDGSGPACLSDAQLDGMLALLRTHFRFFDDGHFEVALDPAHMPQGRLLRLRRQGFNAIRFDCQGAGCTDLPTLARAARAAGFRSLCIALDYSAAGQDAGRLGRMIDAVLAARPDLVLLSNAACADLGTAQGRSGSVARRLRQRCIERLDGAAYVAIGTDRFARPRNPGESSTDAASLQYYPGTYLVGCGVDALGAVGQVLCQNVASLPAYYALLDRNAMPIARVLRRMQPCQAAVDLPEPAFGAVAS